jgi:outer membrane receptor for ferrienterochelin and colicins
VLAAAVPARPAAAQPPQQPVPVPVPAAAADEPAAVQRVVVTATRGPLLALLAPAAMTVVTAGEIALRGADNVLEAVRGEPGLSLQGRAVGGRKVFAVRGLDSRHTLFLVDGRRIGASDGTVGASDFAYDWVNVGDIERIEVVRGPLSVLYGTEALGGVINVVTREAGDRWRLGALAEGSRADGGRGGDGHRAGAWAGGPLQADDGPGGDPSGAGAGNPARTPGRGLFLRTGAADSRVAALASPADPRLSELEGRSRRDGWLALGWRGAGARRVDLDLRGGSEERSAGARERGGLRRYHQTFNDIERVLAALSWEWEWGGAAAALPPAATQLRAYRSALEVTNRRTAGVAVNAPQRLEDTVLDGQWRGAADRAGAHALTAGFETRNEALQDPTLPGGRAVALQRALFAQDEWAVTPALTLTGGLRHDRHSLYGPQWSPRLYAVWTAAPGWAVKGGASHGFKAPNLKQIVPGPRQEGPNVFLGQPALRPESADSLELGVDRDAGTTQWQLMAFAMRVRDLIDVRLVSPGPVAGTGTYTYDNLARATLRGLEGGLSQRLGGGFTAGLGATLLDARDGAGQRLERRPRHSAQARLDWAGTAWRANLRAEFTGPQRLPAATVGQPAQDAPSLTMLHAQVSRRLGGGTELALGVRNLGDLRLAERSPLFTQAEPPRTWRLTLRGTW